MSNVIFWNLPPSLAYIPGAILPVIIFLSNPETVLRQYAVRIRISRNGVLLAEDGLEVGDQTIFTIPGGGSLVLYEALFVDLADILLELVVSDVLTENYVGSVAINLVSATVGQTPAYLPSIVAVGAMSALAQGLLIGG